MHRTSQAMLLLWLLVSIFLVVPGNGWVSVSTLTTPSISVSGFNTCNRRSSRSSRDRNIESITNTVSMCENDNGLEDESLGSPTKWSNPNYSAEQLKQWWDGINRALISVGGKGVQQSHVNSLRESLRSHERVKVKLASDRMNSIDTAADFINNDLLKNNAELLECRKREFMVGRTDTTPVQPVKIGKTRDQSWFKNPKK